MSPAYKVPARAELREVLTALLGEVVVSEARPPAEAATDCVSLYVDDQNRLAAVCIVCFDLAVAAAAAIALVPAAVVGEAHVAGELTGSLRDNLREVMNVLATLLCNDETPHVKFSALLLARAEMGPEAIALVARPAARLDVGVDLGDYGGGTLSILAR